MTSHLTSALEWGEINPIPNKTYYSSYIPYHSSIRNYGYYLPSDVKNSTAESRLMASMPYFNVPRYFYPNPFFMFHNPYVSRYNSFSKCHSPWM